MLTFCHRSEILDPEMMVAQGFSASMIVSSRHLAEGEHWEMSEFEYGLIVAYNAFSRWMVRCMAAAGESDLTVLDILVLHNVNHRGREKRLKDICFLLNIEDTHTVNYALHKLLRVMLLTSEKRGKEVFYRTSAKGAALCGHHIELRGACLGTGIGSPADNSAKIQAVATQLRNLSGLYDHVSRTLAAF